VLKGVGAAAAVAAIALTIAVGGRAWDEFSSSDLQFPDRPETHFSNFSGAGRHDFWRVAGDSFEEKPVLGHGAGTYEFSWEGLRSIEAPVHDAHSLYLEAFSELGAIGGVLVLALIGTLLWTGFAAWRAARGSQRELYAVLLAAMVAFAVGAALDWFWELAGLGVVFFLAAGVLVAARCGQIAPGAGSDGARAQGRRYGLGVAGLAVAWIAAVALVGPLLVEREIDSSRDAAVDGNLVSAVDHAERARSIEPWAASPYVQLGLLAQLQEDQEAAIQHFTGAIEREDQNWQWYYLRSEVEQEAGDSDAARADLERARELNPRAACLREEGWNCR
jgi:tetratricopeptide (TPR) repeat protein